MDRGTYEITLADEAGELIPPDNGGRLLLGVAPAVRAVSLMAIQGRGVAKGRRPSWLHAVSDVRFRGASVNGGATFIFDAPRLGDAAEQLFQQRDFWLTEYSPNDTGFDLLASALHDVQEENVDSNRFDQGVLRTFKAFQRVLSDRVSHISLDGEQITEPVRFDRNTIRHVENLARTTPPEQRVRIVGELDMLKYSTSMFKLILDTGDRVRGVYEGDIAQLSNKLRERVVVSGHAIFRPSGKLLRVDAERLEEDSSAPALWSHIPTPKRTSLEREQLWRPQGSSSGISAIMNRWPGDEDDEEVARQLERLS